MHIETPHEIGWDGIHNQKSWEKFSWRGKPPIKKWWFNLQLSKELIPPGAHPPDVLGMMPPGLKPEKAHLYKTPSGRREYLAEGLWVTRKNLSTLPTIPSFWCQALLQTMSFLFYRFPKLPIQKWEGISPYLVLRLTRISECTFSGLGVDFSDHYCPPSACETPAGHPP